MKYLVIVSLLFLISCNSTETTDEVVNGLKTVVLSGVKNNERTTF